MTFSVFN